LKKEEDVKYKSFGRTVFMVLMIFGLIACGASPPVGRAVDTTKIPITTASDEARDAFLKGRWLLDNLRATEAHEYFLKAVEADPNFALGLLRVANTASTTQEFFAALRRAVELSVSASEGEKLLIEAFEEGFGGEPKIQQAKLEALVALFPEDERAHNTIGNFFYFNRQDYERAISSYRAAIDINPNFPQPYNMLGYSLRIIGDFAAAEEAFQRYTELIPDQPNPYASYAELLMRVGRHDESITSYERALEIDPNFIASYIGIGNNQMFMGRQEDARSTFGEIDEMARNDGERRLACTWRAASYLHENEFESAFDEIQRRYDIAAETDDRGASDATDDVKEATERNQKWDLARVALWKADTEAASELANAYRDAVAAHKILFEVQRTHELDGMIALAEGDLETALGHFEQANQQNPQIWLLKARTYAAMGDPEGARSACEHVIGFNQLNFNLAYVRNPARELLESL
jgi:tetratricopeptide (TPR) repeat protein